MSPLDGVIDGRLKASSGASRDVLVTEQGKRLGSTTKVSTASKAVGRSLVLALAAAGMAHAAGAEAPQGYLVINDQMGVGSAKLAADGCLIPASENGKTKSIAEGTFGVLDGARIVAEHGLDAVLRAGTDGVSVEGAAGLGGVLAASSGRGLRGNGFSSFQQEWWLQVSCAWRAL